MPSIGIATAYPEADWHSKQLIDAASQKAETMVIDPGDLSVNISDYGISVRTSTGSLNKLGGLILLRAINEKGNPDHQIEIYKALSGMGLPMINNIQAALAAQDKFRSSFAFRQAGLPAPRVVTVQNFRDGISYLREMERAVIKPIYGSLGEGIMRLSADDEGISILKGYLERDGVVYLQKYIDKPNRDIRVFVIGGRVAAAVYRVASEGEWITNIHCGARALPCDLSSETEALSIKAAASIGLDYTGVDIIETDRGPLVIEVNGSPHWQGVHQATGKDIAGLIVEHMLKKMES
ncbi:MAG: RimK family alpha-L-glutamate ligase [bacterium]|jgi:RimK family alpha-L-glutamate ligase|nr:RimK family alpha-L-glutamate ligase [bacterium]MDD4153532.1 RimK family alpha-L-glutamate ligase [bacterium]MDD4559046.1 RimK family alpha-L-glutamate ligase [bacterium]